MKQRYFIKFNSRINQLTGCQTATLILSSLEYWFTKKPDGFYKFMEPCSHPLYREGDSWKEELGCERRCFARSFQKIGIKYRSRNEYDKAADKFQGKMYASYYDRYTNQIFFIRNHSLVDESLKDFSIIKSKSLKNEEGASKPSISLPNLPLGTGKDGRSYIDAENTSKDLSLDKSHAGNEVAEQMVDIWVAIVGEGKGQIDLRGKTIAFLKVAFTDQFSSCLQKWKEYCISIARSRFLMGEKTSFKATLEWALKFDVIAKILSGECYGIGDRNRKLTPEELAEQEQAREAQQQAKEVEKQRSIQALEEEIRNRPEEPDSVKNFRIKWLSSFGEQNYRQFLADSLLKIGSEETELIIQPRERLTAVQLESYWNPEILSGQPFRRVQIYHYIADFMGKPLLFDRWVGELEDGKSEQEQGENITPVKNHDPSMEGKDARTAQLRARLKAEIPAKDYPVWLDDIKVQTIKPDGILVATFRDRLTSDYARISFSEKILKSAVGLWSEVAGLSIHNEPDYLSGHEGNECLETDERILVQQAIQSFFEISSSGTGQGGGILDDYIPH